MYSGFKFPTKGESLQPFLPKPGGGARTLSDILDEALGEPGRFRSVLSAGERYSLRLKNKLLELAGLEDVLTLNAAEDAVSSPWRTLIKHLHRSGVISSPSIQLYPMLNDEPKIYSVRLTASAPEQLTDGTVPAVMPVCRGTSLAFEDALSKAVGESLERYALALYRRADLLRASIADLQKKRKRFLNPFHMAGFSQEQKLEFPERNFDETSVFYWVLGESLTNKVPAYIPAQLVFRNYFRQPDEPFLVQSSTNGAAGFFTQEGALLAGLLELVQRDAFLVHWMNGIAPKRVDLSSAADSAIKDLRDRFSRYGFRLEIMDITSDLGIPAFAAALIDPGRIPFLSVGAGCGFKPEAAAVQGIVEAFGIRYGMRRNAQKNESGFNEFSMPITQNDRARLWSDPAMLSKLQFFISGESRPLPRAEKEISHAESLERVCRDLSRRGPEYEVFAYMPRNSVLKEVGFHSAKVAVPALIPLYFNEKCAPWGAERLRSATPLPGDAPAAFNPVPHPFL